jgi:hypothetical protein
MKRTIALAFALALAVAAGARADQAPTFKGPESPSEQAFVKAIQSDLGTRFPTAAAAEKAGYVRYTNVDDTGAISYANLQWNSTDIKHPSQLWYDKQGRLLGADFSVPLSVSATRPNLWGVNPGRWYEFDGHIHWVAKGADGKLSYDNYMMDDKFKAAGGDPEHPTAADLVRLKKVANVSDVVTVFHFPAIWDLIVWLKPNPNGAFAEKNPAVTP